MNKGSVLLSSLIFGAILMLLAGTIADIALNAIAANNDKKKLIKVFYLSEAGINHAKSIVALNPIWYTDAPGIENNKNWLLSIANGQIYYYGNGGYKIIKESGINRIYSIGFIGSNISSSNVKCYQKIKYNVPFRQSSWELF